MYALTLLPEEFPSAEKSTISVLSLIEARCYVEAAHAAEEMMSELRKIKLTLFENNLKNHTYIYSCFCQLLLSTVKFWKLIEDEQYYESWWKLQDALDSLRNLKRFYKNKNQTITYLTNQLCSLEKIYPYKYFSSCGFIVEKFECSLCGHDINSDNCVHIKGDLYSGEMAVSVARNIKRLDHVAIVTNPKNKRLVFAPDDTRQEFNLFRQLVLAFKSGSTSPLGFTKAELIESMRIDDRHSVVPRNSRCSCGSDKKYKKCCIGRERIRHVHMDVFPGYLITP